MAGPQNTTTSTAVPRGAPTSRRRPVKTGDEEAGLRLRLGEFTNVQALSVAEVNLMLSQLEARGENNQFRNTDIYLKTREYCKTFARFKDASIVTQVNQISTELTQRALGITEFERAQLGRSLNLSSFPFSASASA
jgi:DNA-directed RNA polymerase II subunit RPB4